MKVVKTLLAAVLAFSALLSCKKEADPYMTLSEKELTIGSDGGVLTLDVKANVYYRVNNDCDFLVVSELSQEGDTRTYLLDVKANAKTEDRADYIRFIGDYVTPLRVLVTQKAYVPYGVDPVTLDATWDETEAVFEVLGEQPWTASVDNDWFTLSKTSGDTGGKVRLSFSKNETDTPETGIVTVIINEEEFTVTITQKAEYSTSVEPSELNPGFGDTKATFNIYTPLAWTVECDNPAFVLSATSGTGDAAIDVTFPENEEEVAKVANVTVKVLNKSYPVTITQAAAPKKEYKDLSASGTSNCYLISEGGYYKFKATVRGNGVVPASQSGFQATINPASVKVLWTTFNTSTAPADDNAVISKLEFKDGYVWFFYKGTAGNAVVAAYDAGGNIIWSWHIWATSVGSDIQVGTNCWMDRNVGALAPSTYGTTDALSAGMFFQWGRKDPFRGTYTFQEPSEGDCDMATTGTWPAAELIVDGKGGIANSIATPQVFWYVSGSNYNNKDWIWGEQFNDLWGAGAVASKSDLSAFPKTTKTLFDPCPVGYCVPTSLQFNETGTTLGITKNDIIKIESLGQPYIYGIGNDTFYLVYPSGKAYDSGKVSGHVGNVGQYSWYATSCTNGVNQMCARSHTTAFNWGGASAARCYGYSVRCVKE